MVSREKVVAQYFREIRRASENCAEGRPLQIFLVKPVTEQGDTAPNYQRYRSANNECQYDGPHLLVLPHSIQPCTTSKCPDEVSAEVVNNLQPKLAEVVVNMAVSPQEPLVPRHPAEARVASATRFG